MIKAALFDFDGVIAESFDVKTNAFARLFAPYGPAVVDRVVAHHLAHGGVSRFVKILHYHEHFVGRAIDHVELDDWCRRFSELVLDAVVAAPLVPGALELLEQCHARYACFIVTGTPQEEMEQIASRKDLAKYFLEIHGSPRTKSEIVRQIMAAHGLRSEEAVFLGDALADYEAASDSGLRFIGRVAAGQTNLFPPDIPEVQDFSGISLESFWPKN
jgi:phosphoglycolate phosphatase-like HAD superfamily hydrolase